MPTMKTKSGLLRLLAVVILWSPALVSAGDPLLPDVPPAQRRVSAAQGCVEPTPDMRRNHMKYILHHRNETMREGIRTKTFSLNECIDCHVSSAPDAPRASSPKHFCNSCHTYAAVHIDCFECHADRPINATEHNLPPQIIPPPQVQTDTKPIALLPATHRSLTTESIDHD
jgi:hypothetical protein